MKNLLFTAPHTIPTVRIINGRVLDHPRELYILKILNSLKVKGFRVIYNTFDVFDPNFYENSRFKKKILIGQTHNIDVHGMKDEYGIDVCIGTARKNYDLTEIIEFLKSKGLKVGINYPFSGISKLGGETITDFLQKRGIKAIQLELSLKTRKRQDIVEILAVIGDIFSKL